jgi:hypothetical protein
MRRVPFIALLVLTIVIVVGGIWYFVRDEYPFQLVAGDVTGATVESLAGAKVFGVVPSPPADLAGWVSSSERDSTDMRPPATMRITIALRDGRLLRLDVGPEVTYGTWLGGEGAAGPPDEIATSHDLYWYLAGVAAGLRSR